MWVFQQLLEAAWRTEHLMHISCLDSTYVKAFFWWYVCWGVWSIIGIFAVLVNLFSTNWHHHSWWKPGQGSRIMCPYNSSFRLPLKLSVKMGLPEGLMIPNNKWYKGNHPSLRDPYVICFFTGSMRVTTTGNSTTKLTPESPVEQCQRHAKKNASNWAWIEALLLFSPNLCIYTYIYINIYMCIFIPVLYVYTTIYNMYMHINMRNT